jgi:poly(3-hydroxybutyrate) depolymerase
LYFGVEQASAGQAILVYPQGLPQAAMGNQAGWDLSPTGVDVQLFDELLQGFSDAYCIDLDAVFATGHSFGAYMSNTLGCARPDRLRAIAPVAGGGPFGQCTPNLVAAWLAHGEFDSQVPIDQGVGSRDHWLAQNGCGDTTAPADPSPCVAYEGCDEGYPVHWCVHQDESSDGHGWPSFAADGIWSFFDALREP